MTNTHDNLKSLSSGSEHKFCYPLRDLENDRLLLTIFDPAKHAAAFVEASTPHPTLFSYLPFGPFKDADHFLTSFYQPRITSSPATCLFAIYNKPTKDEGTSTSSHNKLAGICGYLNGAPENLKVEIGFLIVIPEFQRTHVSSNAAGLLIKYALDLPERGGLGLRRCQWQANHRNAGSLKAAQRMGLTLEGVMRWERLLPDLEGKETNGEEMRSGDPRANMPGRHSAVLAMCWDDWELRGGREKVEAVMARQS